MKSILCYGDSNTWGSATRDGFEPRYLPHERWPGVLGASLGKDWHVVAEGLSARTTVHADPIEGLYLDGAQYLLPCLRSHRPLDIVAIMLGTNDLKHRFGMLPEDIALSIEVLLKIVAKAESGPDGGAPKALVICPPPILQHHGEVKILVEMFRGGYEKSLKLAPLYEAVAKENGAAFLDAGTIIRSSPFDGIHLDVGAHAALGKAVAAKVMELGW